MRSLSDLSWSELQAALDAAEEQASLAQYADSLTPKRRADERVDAIRREMNERRKRNAT